MPRPPVNPKHPVRILRTVVGLTQPEFAESIGVSAVTVQKIEGGQLDLSDQTKAAIALAFPRESLASGLVGPAFFDQQIAGLQERLRGWRRAKAKLG